MIQDIFTKMKNSIKSHAMKTTNADKKRLKGIARLVYLEGYAGLSKCEKFTLRGNQGRGFVVAKVINPEMEDKFKKNEADKKEKKARRKKQKTRK